MSAGPVRSDRAGLARGINLSPLPELYAICRLPPNRAIPEWADGAGFVSIARTSDELSILCRADRVPDEVRAERGWRCLKLEGPFDFDQTGIAASVLAPLASANIGILIISTFDTDYLLVKETGLEEALAALRASGHVIAS